MWVPLVVLAILSFSFWFKSPFVEKGWFQTLITKPATVANIAKAPAAPASMEHAAVMAPAPHGEEVSASDGVLTASRGSAPETGSTGRLRPTGLQPPGDSPRGCPPRAWRVA